MRFDISYDDCMTIALATADDARQAWNRGHLATAEASYLIAIRFARKIDQHGMAGSYQAGLDAIRRESQAWNRGQLAMAEASEERRLQWLAGP